MPNVSEAASPVGSSATVLTPYEFGHLSTTWRVQSAYPACAHEAVAHRHRDM